MTTCILLHNPPYCNTFQPDDIPLIIKKNIHQNMNGNAYLQNRHICLLNGTNFRIAVSRRRMRGDEASCRQACIFSFHAIPVDILRSRSRRNCFPCNRHGAVRIRRRDCTIRMRSFEHNAAPACTTMGRRTAATRAIARRCRNARTTRACSRPQRENAVARVPSVAQTPCFRRNYDRRLERGSRRSAHEVVISARDSSMRSKTHRHDR